MKCKFAILVSISEKSGRDFQGIINILLCKYCLRELSLQAALLCPSKRGKGRGGTKEGWRRGRRRGWFIGRKEDTEVERREKEKKKGF